MRRALVLTLLLPLLAACDRGPEAQRAAPRTGEAAAATDWVVIDGIEFPAAMAEAPDEVLESYVFAAKHPEILEYMPCYCGCESPAFAHENNYDCFVDAIDRSREVPRVDPDPMGFG